MNREVEQKGSGNIRDNTCNAEGGWRYIVV